MSTEQQASQADSEEIYEIREEDKVPLREKIGYGFGIVTDHWSMNTFQMLYTIFFVQYLHLNPATIGLIILVGRLWDGVSDPLLAKISDNFKSKWGRRRPFILAGGIAMGLIFPLIWMTPEHWSDGAKYTYFAVAMIVFYTCYTMFSVPYESLGAEMTSDYRERTNVYVVRNFVQYTVNLLTYTFAWAIAAGGMLSFVKDSETGKTLDWIWTSEERDSLLAKGVEVTEQIGTIESTRWLMAVVGLVIILSALLPSLLTRERYKEIAAKQDKVNFWTGLPTMVKNKPLVIMIGVMAMFIFFVFITFAYAYFINRYYLYPDNELAGNKLGMIDSICVRAPFALLGAFVLKKISHKYDKKKLLSFASIMMAVSFGSFYFTHTPTNPYLSLITKPFFAFSEAWFWILVISMRADACDWDEYCYGQRREGNIAALCNFVNKIFIALASAVGGVVLTYFIKMDTKQPETLLDPELHQRLMLWYVGPPVVGFILGYVLLTMYPLSASKMKEVRAELEARRGVAKAAD